MFSKSKKETQVYRHDSEKEFNNLFKEAQVNHPNDPMAQITFFKDKGSKYQLLALATITQRYLSIPKGNVTLSSGQLDYIYRAILDLAVHTQIELPSRVYDYSWGNLRDVTNYIIREFEGNEENIVKLRFNTGDKDRIYRQNLEMFSEEELEIFASTILTKTIDTIQSLTSSLVIYNMDIVISLISKMSSNIRDIPSALINKDRETLISTLLYSMEFIEKLDPGVLQNRSILEDYKKVIKEFPVFS